MAFNVYKGKVRVFWEKKETIIWCYLKEGKNKEDKERKYK